MDRVYEFRTATDEEQAAMAADVFSSEPWKSVLARELPKTAKEKRVISLAHAAAHNVWQHLMTTGTPWYDVPTTPPQEPENVHVLQKRDFASLAKPSMQHVPASAMMPGTKHQAFTEFRTQHVFMARRQTLVTTAVTIFHERIHGLSHNRIWRIIYADEGTALLIPRRSGLWFIGRNREHDRKDREREWCGYWLNEAVIEELTRAFFEQIMMPHPLFAEELALLKAAREDPESFFPAQSPREQQAMARGCFFIRKATAREQAQRNARPFRHLFFGYTPARVALSRLIQRISTETGQNVTEVLSMFCRAMFVGSVLTLARTIEHVLGRGKFTTILEQPDNVHRLCE